MRIKIYSGLTLLLLCGTAAKAQHGLNSIYSAYGIGDMETRDYSRNYGLGSSGIARRHSGYLNELNPASYSAIPNQNFMFDVSIKAQQINYNGAGISNSAGDVNFKRLALGFKATSFWGISAGIAPFSSIDYKILNQQFVTGTGAPVTTTTTGTGGFNRAYISNGFAINKHFSVGVSTAFLFGPINVSQNIGSDSLQTQHNKYGFKPNFTAGAQYVGKINKDWQLGLGATYRFQTKMKLQEKLNIVDINGTSLFSKDQDPSYFTLPAEYGGGIALTNGTFTWVADYRHSLWNSLNEKGPTFTYVDGQRYSTGIEYTLKRQYYNQMIEGAVLQAGFAFNQTPLVVSNTQIKDISGTLGVSLPSKNGQLRYYIGLEAGQRGTSGTALIKETYVNAIFHFSLRDLWFLKRLAQ
ncbi:hypothetical protein HGH93_23850 [Chitinophaga polysaccharea]|uniref:hypothetical protein n=1 Tax=Chitinophaga TaxID=79328 RepID=UPI001455C3EF|nr:MULTISPECIES: hypothetical protein [Chitinophaga]NLR61156.1 hypothetical protein [Chitinophaga polysaccharea]NLU94994.1 hypothetical protein [Chitinophaga sp. Ak27]